MLHSLIDEEIGKNEFEMITSQDHFETSWNMMENIVKDYAIEYFDGIARSSTKENPQQSYSIFLKNLIKQNDKMNQKYLDIFDMQLMDDDYQEDVDGFKNNILKKQCDVIRNGLSSKTDALKEWKIKFQSAKTQNLYDTFYNFLDFAQNYDNEMDEVTMNSMNTIHENKLVVMNEDQCYQLGIIGYGIVSRILNIMYPRVFPGNYKMGLFALHFLSGHKDEKDIIMPSGTSEFCMVNDDEPSDEADHNYYYSYGTFGLYTLRIYRSLEKMINERFSLEFPTDYRFLLTNDFYNFVITKHKTDIQALTGNADIFKFDFSF